MEDEKYSDLKSELRREIGGLRERLLEMMGSNEEAPELERLGREEFILDMEEQERLQREEDEQIRLVSLRAPDTIIELKLRLHGGLRSGS